MPAAERSHLTGPSRFAPAGGRHGRLRAFLVWVMLAVLGAIVLVRLDIAERRERFRVDAATVHRLLSQQAARHEALLAMLDLIATQGPPMSRAGLDALPRRFPWIIAAEQRPAAQPMSAGDAAVRVTDVDQVRRRYTLVRAGSPLDHALRIDAGSLIDGDGWPLPDDAAMQVRLLIDGEVLSLGRAAVAAEQPFGLTEGFRFEQRIDSPSQPFVLSIRKATGPAAWPWGLIAGWLLGSGLLVLSVFTMLRARDERRRAAELARLAQAARLDQLGELAAGIAHELNQPLAAILSGTQAALRLLDAAEPGPGTQPTADPTLGLTREAMQLAVGQARRASDVLNRMRRLVEPVRADRPRRPVALDRLIGDLLRLLAPELARQAVTAAAQGQAVTVLVDPVAIEQILHNLIVNAAQAMARQRQPRRIDIGWREVTGSAGQVDDGLPARRARVVVRDNGPGIAADVMPRLFEPFFTTRPDGLGLGLALCESLARAQGGELRAVPVSAGACFELDLPLAGQTPDRISGLARVMPPAP